MRWSNASLALTIVGALVVGCRSGNDAAAGSTGTGTGGTATDGGTSGDAGPSLPSRPSTRYCRFDGLPPGLLPPVTIEPILAPGTAPDPRDLAPVPGRPDLLYLAGAGGAVIVDPEAPGTPVRSALDLPGGIVDAVAPAPWFGDDGSVLVRYRPADAPSRTVVAWMGADADGILDPGAARIVVQVLHDADAPVGGWLGFGPDGMLVVPLGDAGDSEAVDDLGQRPGKVLRFDVRATGTDGGHAVPADNPWADAGGAQADVWAYGVRDPERCGFDPADGSLWCGDVGELGSEISPVPAGGDLGWPSLEGRRCLLAGGCGDLETIAPVATWPHEDGACGAVGGVTYRGTAEPELQGVLLYADRCSGEVFGLQLGDDGLVEQSALVARLDVPIVAFAGTDEGEVWALDADGGVGRIAVDRPAGEFPTRLSESGCFEDLAALSPAADVVPYEVNAPLWTDAAVKSRFFALPPGTTLDVDDTGHLVFPVGAAVLKVFAFPFAGASGRPRPVETRVMVKRELGWEFHSYRWNAAGTEAELLSAGETVTLDGVVEADGATALEYLYPSRADCTVCHGRLDAGTLGPRLDQLDRTVDYATGSANQLEAMASIGLFDRPLPGHVRMPAPDDAAAPLGARARAYLHANCGHCHRPGGWTPPEMTLDLRWRQTLAGTQSCGEPVQYWNPWVSGTDRIAPGDPDMSVIWERIDQRGPGQMPPLATAVIDPGAAVVRDWIAELSSCP